jgi:hypothetical protein
MTLMVPSGEPVCHRANLEPVVPHERLGVAQTKWNYDLPNPIEHPAAFRRATHEIAADHGYYVLIYSTKSTGWRILTQVFELVGRVGIEPTTKRLRGQFDERAPVRSNAPFLTFQ